MCPTQVRCAIGVSEVSRAIRSVMRDGAVAGRAAGAVRHRDERRLQRLELADRAPQLLARRPRPWAGRTRRRTTARPRAMQLADARRAGRRGQSMGHRDSIGGGAVRGRGLSTAVAPARLARVTTQPRWDAAALPRRASRPRSTRFLDEQAARLAPLGRRRRPAASPRRARAVVRRQAVPGGVLLLGLPRGRGPTADDEDALVRACAALELLHASALVHDDYMDASDTRRGRPATHRGVRGASTASDGWRGDPEQYGAAAAILLGDLLLSLVRRAAAPLRAAARAWSRRRSTSSTRAAREVIAGQFLDVSVQARGARRRRRRR